MMNKELAEIRYSSDKAAALRDKLIEMEQHVFVLVMVVSVDETVAKMTSCS